MRIFTYEWVLLHSIAYKYRSNRTHLYAPENFKRLVLHFFSSFLGNIFIRHAFREVTSAHACFKQITFTIFPTLSVLLIFTLGTLSNLTLPHPATGPEKYKTMCSRFLTFGALDSALTSRGRFHKPMYTLRQALRLCAELLGLKKASQKLGAERKSLV